MKSSTILREAARFIEIERFIGGCAALNRAAWDTPDEQRAFKYFTRVGPAKPTCKRFWWEVGPGPIPARHPEARAARIIGLCLAASIAESEGD